MWVKRTSQLGALFDAFELLHRASAQRSSSDTSHEVSSMVTLIYPTQQERKVRGGGPIAAHIGADQTLTASPADTHICVAS